MTPKQRVLKRYPKAFTMKRPFGTVVYMEHAYGDELGCAVTARGAWEEAANRLRRLSSTTLSKQSTKEKS